MLSLLLKHQILCAPTEFKHVIDRENEGASRLYGDWVVQQFTNLNELTDSHLRHIVGRLMKVLMLSNQSVEEQVKSIAAAFRSIVQYRMALSTVDPLNAHWRKLMPFSVSMVMNGYFSTGCDGVV